MSNSQGHFIFFSIQAMKNSLPSIILVVLVSGSILFSCSPDDPSTSDPQANVKDMLVEGNGWHIELKSESQNTFLGNNFIRPVEIRYMNNAFYETYFTQMITSNEYDVFRKIENGKVFMYEYPKQGVGMSYRLAWRIRNGFCFLPNETAEYGYDDQNGAYRMFKDGVLLYSFPQGNEVSPESEIYTYSVNYNLKRSVNLNPYNFIATVLDIPTGKITRFKGSGLSGDIGLNNGSFVWDEKITQNTPTNFKIYYGSVVTYESFNMRLNVAELTNINTTIVGDPHTTGHYLIDQPQSNTFLSSLQGIGYYFGDSQVIGFDQGDKVYFMVKLVLMPDFIRLYEYDKATKKITLAKGWTAGSLPEALTQMAILKIYFRPVHNDMIIVGGTQCFKIDLATFAIKEITPVFVPGTEGFATCQVGERIYGTVSQMKSYFADEKNYITNLFYYE